MSRGEPIATDAEGTLNLAVPDLESGSGTLDTPVGAAIDLSRRARRRIVRLQPRHLAGVLAIMGGLLVVFSPCALHMTAFFLPVVTGLGMQEISARKGDVEFRAHVALSGFAFVAGFVAALHRLRRAGWIRRPVLLGYRAAGAVPDARPYRCRRRRHLSRAADAGCLPVALRGQPAAARSGRTGWVVRRDRDTSALPSRA